MHLRTALAFCLVASGPAFAQPANDACDNALAIPAPAGLESTRSPVTAVFGASSQIEAPIACAPAPQNSVWYSFTPTVAGRYELSTCNTGYLQTSVEDFAMAVYSGPCNALSLVTNGCNDTWCGDRPRVVVDLLAGQTYRIQIARADSPTETADTVQLSAVRTSGADSCAGPVPELTLDTTVAVATIEGETNDAQVGGGAACYLGVGNSTTATTQEASRRDRVHRFTAPRNGRYSFRTGFSLRSYDVGLHLSDSCVAPMTPPQVYTPPQCIAAANRLGASTTAQEEVSCLPMITGQQLYVWVDEGVVQPTASIGGTVGLVVTECTVETEPNDSPATASALACGTTGTSAVEVLQADGGITRSGGDVDFFSLGQPQAGDRLFAMVEAAAASSSTLQMRVTTNTDTVEYDTDDLDTDFGGSSGGVAGTPLTAQPHFLRVNADSATTTIQPYHVYAVIQSGTPTPESEPNDTPATANLAPNNYFSGTTPGNTTATFDVDFFAFQAKAGDLIYLSLDSHPQRSGTTPTPNHTLALWDAYGQQVFVNAANTAVLNTTGTGMTATTPEVPSENVLYRATYTGTYYARVSRTGTNAAASLEYVLSVSINCSTGGGFTQPALSSVSPTQGSSLGGETVTLSGSGFGPASQVTFDGARATVSASSPNQLIVRTPVGSEGRADVAVTNLGYAASVLDGGFEYVTPVAPRTVTTVTPAQGAVTGGQTVTITG
ncbi:MAG: IPT/TIG domain-containing protein, partial [Archangium sp.]